MSDLMSTSNAYLADIKTSALAKPSQERSAFENKALSIEQMEDIVSDFALARAGYITPHEFLFQQVFNVAYRDEANKHYGADYSAEKLQTAMNTLLRQHYVEDYHPAGGAKGSSSASLSRSFTRWCSLNRSTACTASHF